MWNQLYLICLVYDFFFILLKKIISFSQLSNHALMFNRSIHKMFVFWGTLNKVLTPIRSYYFMATILGDRTRTYSKRWSDVVLSLSYLLSIISLNRSNLSLDSLLIIDRCMSVVIAASFYLGMLTSRSCRWN